MESEANCVGYALRRLEITAREIYIDPIDVDWGKYFVSTQNQQEADAVIVTYIDPMEGEQLEHISVLDTQDKNLVWHRRQNGSIERMDTLEELRVKFSDPIFDIRFVKVRKGIRLIF